MRTIALIFCTFTYLLIGAAVFDKLESEHEKEERKKLQDEENLIKEKYNITQEDMEILRLNIIRSKPYQAGTQWKFAGAFYFALSVITTIGYGHSTPRTVGGKIFCVLYSLIGIPLNIVMFQSIGERFNIGITKVLKQIKVWVKRATKNDAVEVTQTELTMVACFLCSAVLVLGAVAFSKFESWSFINAFYYCFITMSTIGFGDFVALQNNTMKALQKKPDYVVFSILYIVFGLTVFAAALNLMVLRLLTMNTEDERKDELEALAAAQGAVKLDGDIITPGMRPRPVPSMTKNYDDKQINEGIRDSSIGPSTHSRISILPNKTNGFITINTNKAVCASRSMEEEDLARECNHGEHLCSIYNCSLQNADGLGNSFEEVVDVETVLAAFPSNPRHSLKRSSV